MNEHANPAGRPEIPIAAAFAVGLVAAMILKRVVLS